MSNLTVAPAPKYEKIFFGIGMQWQETNNRGKEVLGGGVRQGHKRMCPNTSPSASSRYLSGKRWSGHHHHHPQSWRGSCSLPHHRPSGRWWWRGREPRTAPQTTGAQEPSLLDLRFVAEVSLPRSLPASVVGRYPAEGGRCSCHSKEPLDSIEGQKGLFKTKMNYLATSTTLVDSSLIFPLVQEQYWTEKI